MINLDGLLRMCHDMEPNQHAKMSMVSRMCTSRDSGDSLQPDNIIKHHTIDVIKHRMRNGDIVCPVLPMDLDSVLTSCPHAVVDDFIHLWSIMNQGIVGISQMTPTFSDGVIDYDPSKVGPKWFLCSIPPFIHSYVHDPTYRLYSGFMYLPESFCMTQPRMQQDELSTDSFCWNHLHNTNRVYFNKNASEQFIRANCIPRPDKTLKLTLQDDLYVKVPRMNSSLPHSIMACNSLRCLTLFPICHIKHKLRSAHFTMSGYGFSGNHWQYDFIKSCGKCLLNLILYSTEDSLIKNCEDLNKFFLNFWFFSEFLINNGACLIHEGNVTPGRGSKCSMLQREFFKLGSFQRNICRGETKSCT